MKIKLFHLLSLFVFILSGCNGIYNNQISTTESALPSTTPSPEVRTNTPGSTSTKTQIPTPTPTITFTPIPAAVGPDAFPPGINPLSGLPVENPEDLLLPPALVSISNSPVVTRPQAGLSFSPLVFEIYIGVGASRYLAVFYGDYPVLKDGSPGDIEYGYEEAMVGPIRSGRIPYESLRKIYNGFLIFASASHRVLPHLDEYYIFYNDDMENYNLAMLEASQIKQLAEEELEDHSKRALLGLRFDSQSPEGGKPAQRIWLPFHELDQIVWEYNPSTGSYYRYQDQEDGETFIQMTDRLTGEALEFENVIILFADYTFQDATFFDINLMYIRRYPALLFRDGKMHEIYWTTGNDEFERTTGFLRPIRFIDSDGNAFPLKHGQTWVEIIPRFSPYYEIPEEDNFANLSKQEIEGSGNWLISFQQPTYPIVE